MSTNTKLSFYDFDRIKKEISDLKVLLTDQLSSQVKINGELRSEMETMKLRVGQFGRLNRVLKFVVNKYKEQKIEMNLLIKLLRGKLENVECECGRMVKSLSVVQVEQKEKEIEEEEEKKNESDNENRSSSRRSEKRKRRRERKKELKLESIVTAEVIEREEKSTEIENMVSGVAPAVLQQRFTYTENQRARIGRKVLGWLSQFGLLESLNENGEWIFRIRDGYSDNWSQIVNNEDVSIVGRLILLPQELFGLTVRIQLSGINCNNNNDEFQISLFVPSLAKENKSIALPVELNVEVRIKLLNYPQYRFSDRHRFTINKLRTYAVPDNFRLSFNNTDREKLPEMIFTFSK